MARSDESRENQLPGPPEGREGSRDRYRDNDDARDPLEGEARTGGGSYDTKSEARGDARENIGNHARGTDASPTGPEGNDRQGGGRQQRDEFDRDLDADNRNRGGSSRA